MKQLPLMIFDGDCGICTKLARFAENKLENKAEVMPFFDVDLDKIDPRINEKLAMKTVIYIRGDKYYIRSRAIFEILKDMPGIYKVPGFLFGNKLFSFIFDPVYNMVAKNRAKISKIFGFDACKLTFGKEHQ